VPVVVLREPGGVALAERLREVVKDPDATIPPRAEALIYAAARAALVEDALTPHLAAGTWVLLDRFVDSSLAYQGGGRDLGVEDVRAINRFATGDVVPDRTVLLRIAPAAGRARQAGRGEEPDRLEREDERFFTVIADTYDALAAAEPERFRVVDASPPADDVARAVLAAVDDLLP
jgi:dTMP kinase